VLGNILLATVVDSLVGLVGVFSLPFSQEKLQRIVDYLVAFAAGAMIGGAFLHLLPEAMELTAAAGELAVVGFLGFFLSERLLSWKHCHNLKCDKHSVGWLVVIGDALHNVVDGLVIASAFLVDAALGWTTTLAIIAHEVPQEIGNFAVLIHGGFSRTSATLWTFLSQATCLLGGLAGYFLGAAYKPFLIALAAGGFIYIAAVDLLPELHHRAPLNNFLLFLVGVLIMEGLKLLLAV